MFLLSSKSLLTSCFPLIVGWWVLTIQWQFVTSCYQELCRHDTSLMGLCEEIKADKLCRHDTVWFLWRNKSWNYADMLLIWWYLWRNKSWNCADIILIWYLWRNKVGADLWKRIKSWNYADVTNLMVKEIKTGICYSWWFFALLVLLFSLTSIHLTVCPPIHCHQLLEMEYIFYFHLKKYFIFHLLAFTQFKNINLLDY